MKISTKLSLALLIIICIGIVLQIMISEQIISDQKILESTPQLHSDIFEKTKTYREFDCKPFIDIYIKNMDVTLVKSDRFGVFYNKYRTTTQLEYKNNTLYLNSEGRSNRWNNRVFIFMPIEPAKVTMDAESADYLKIYDFTGDHTTVHLRNGYMRLSTNMQFLDLQTDSVNLTLSIDKYDTYMYYPDEPTDPEGKNARKHPINIVASARNKSEFGIDPSGRNHINVDLKLDESNFQLTTGNYTTYRNIFISGTLWSSYNYIHSNSDYNNSVPFYCDSLVIDVSGKPEEFFGIELPKKIEANYYTLKKSDNISLTCESN